MDKSESNGYEIWDIYDKNRIKTGQTHRRGVPLAKDNYHLVVHVCIFNRNNEMLIQHRQPWKTGWPNMWDLSVGGSSVAGEDSIQAAERETREELGYEIDLSEERPFFTINFKHGFDDFYIVEQELELSELHLQQEEVQAVKWASKDEIKKMVREGIFIDYYFLDVMFEMRKQRGAIREK